jgi:hypothetical protein
MANPRAGLRPSPKRLAPFFRHPAAIGAADGPFPGETPLGNPITSLEKTGPTLAWFKLEQWS